MRKSDEYYTPAKSLKKLGLEKYLTARCLKSRR